MTSRDFRKLVYIQVWRAQEMYWKFLGNQRVSVGNGLVTSLFVFVVDLDVPAYLHALRMNKITVACGVDSATSPSLADYTEWAQVYARMFSRSLDNKVDLFSLIPPPPRTTHTFNQSTIPYVIRSTISFCALVALCCCGCGFWSARRSQAHFPRYHKRACWCGAWMDTWACPWSKVYLPHIPCHVIWGINYLYMYIHTLSCILFGWHTKHVSWMGCPYRDPGGCERQWRLHYARPDPSRLCMQLLDLCLFTPRMIWNIRSRVRHHMGLNQRLYIYIYKKPRVLYVFQLACHFRRTQSSVPVSCHWKPASPMGGVIIMLIYIHSTRCVIYIYIYVHYTLYILGGVGGS